MATNSNISIFQKLEKFSGRKEDDLVSWLRGFERCCVISQKKDDLVKGQLLMLCLCGQALAVAERFEEEKKEAQKFADLVTKLKAVFNSEADKEYKQEEFEKRHLELNETEDEFMLALIKLHRSANPTSADEELLRNVKRKFMNGISSELKKNIFIFCSTPHATTVSVDELLEAVRKAKVYILEEKSGESVNVVQQATDGRDPILKAIEGLRDSLDNHIQATSEQFKEQSTQINAISNEGFRESSSFHQLENNTSEDRYSRGGWNSRPPERRQRNRDENRGNSNSVQLCYNCHQPNHFARNCTAPRLNSRGRLRR